MSLINLFLQILVDFFGGFKKKNKQTKPTHNGDISGHVFICQP